MKSAEEKYFKPGNIILVHGNSFLSKGIQFFMKIYAKQEHKSDKIFFNHAAQLIDIWGDVWVCEADRTKSKGIQAGVIIRRLEDTSYFKEKNFIILTPKKQFTQDEIGKLSNAAMNFSFRNTRYYYWGTFGRQIKKVLTGKWNDDNVEKDRVYCSELVALINNEVREFTFPDPYACNPQDVYWNDNYNQIDLYGIINSR